MWIVDKEQRAIRKVSKLLSGLDPEAAARVARWAVDAFGDPATPEPATSSRAEEPALTPAGDKPSFLDTGFRMQVSKKVMEAEERKREAAAKAEREAPAPKPKSSDKPSFLQTQYRMEVGKEILESVRKTDKAGEKK